MVNKKIILLFLAIALSGLLIPEAIAQQNSNPVSTFANGNNPAKTGMAGKEFGRQVNTLAKSQRLSNLKRAIAVKSNDLKARSSRITPVTKSSVKSARANSKAASIQKGGKPIAIKGKK